MQFKSILIFFIIIGIIFFVAFFFFILPRHRMGTPQQDLLRLCSERPRRTRGCSCSIIFTSFSLPLTTGVVLLRKILLLRFDWRDRGWWSYGSRLEYPPYTYTTNVVMSTPITKGWCVSSPNYDVGGGGARCPSIGYIPRYLLVWDYVTECPLAIMDNASEFRERKKHETFPWFL